MKLKNNALQELYDTLVSGNPTISPYAESPFDKAFRECDEKIQKDIDIWKCGTDVLISANSDLASIKKKLEKEIEGLKEHVLENHKIITDISSGRDALEKERDNWRARAKYAEDEVERLRKAHDELFNAGSRKISEVRRENEAVNKKLEKDLTDAKVQLHFLTHSRDDWKRRVEHAEDEVEALKKDNEDLEKRLMETTEAFDKVNSDRTELQKDRDYYYELYTKLRKDYDKLFEDNKNLKVRTDCLRLEAEWYRKHYKEQSDKIKRLQDGLREIGYEQGQTDLWDALQNVNDSQPFELAACFPDVTGMEDILSWDQEDFLDAYKKWHEEKEKERLDHMRDYLARFCEGRVCKGCPLESTEYKCGCGYSFKKHDRFDLRIIPDKDIKRYYEKARGCGRYTVKDAKLFATTVEGVNRTISKACENFCKAVRDADIKITENLRKGCTLEATVEVNKDLLEKVCGVKPEEEEHKLEYGDAVRLPWRDYDYMYIGPSKRGDGKMIRLFDPKNHSIAYVSSNEQLDIRGYKIIIGNEEDLRKIWCDKDADKE